MAKCGCRDTFSRSATKKILIISIILRDSLLWLRVIIKKVLKGIKNITDCDKIIIKKVLISIKSIKNNTKLKKKGTREKKQ